MEIFSKRRKIDRKYAGTFPGLNTKSYSIVAMFYPIEQYFVGLITGAVFSWVAATIYYSEKRPSEDESETEEPSAEVEQSKPSDHVPVPVKSVIIYVLDEEHLDRFKSIVEPLMNRITSKAPVDGVSSELDEMFNDALAKAGNDILPQKEKKKTVAEKETLPPPQTMVGPYRTLQQIADVGKAYENVPEGVLSRREEMQIINEFRNLVQTHYYNALATVEERGFTLHPIYLSYGNKMPASSYSPKTIGVRISDPNFDPKSNTPSREAKITEIIDVGGMDYRDIGIIKL